MPRSYRRTVDASRKPATCAPVDVTRNDGSLATCPTTVTTVSFIAVRPFARPGAASVTTMRDRVARHQVLAAIWGQWATAGPLWTADGQPVRARSNASRARAC